MTRRFLIALEYFLAAILVLYLCDWGVLRLRSLHQSAFRQVTVDRFLSTALKNSKYEYDYLGSTEETCSRSIFPHASYPPCWWLQRHRTQWEH